MATTGSWAIPLLAAGVSALFAATVWRAYAARRRPSQLAWALGLTAYALASLVEVRVALDGWTIGLYRAYFPLASGLVGLLGLGTLLLLGNPATTRAATIALALGLLVAGIGQFTVPLALDTPVASEGETKALAEWGSALGAKAVAFPHPSRFASLFLNVAGGLALIGGALLSWWRTRRAGVLLIALGALLPFTGGSLSTLGIPDARVIAQLAGILVMFAGFLAGREAAPATPEANESPART